MLKILQYGSPLLEKKSIDVKNPKDPKILKLIEEMLKVLDKEKDHSAGLSAPQVGELLRIAICRRTDLEDQTKIEEKKTDPIWEVMINPVITKKSKETSVVWEGCLSINDGDLFGKVERPREVEFEFIDLDGKKQYMEANGFFAHVIQHEVDHLDGVLFLKYINDPTELYTSEELESD